MKSVLNLPSGYQEIFKINMKEDRKVMLRISLLSLLLFVIPMVGAVFFAPLSALFEGTFISILIKWVAIIVGMIVYIIIHELVHGIFMKIFSRTKVRYGFKGIYAYAGSSAYYSKRAYIIIALAPVVILGAILALMNCVVPISWFWVVYFIQCYNISGSAGDIYVSCKMGRMQRNILIHDIGDIMTVYTSIN